jgi:two-component system cell cycle response regulator
LKILIADDDAVSRSVMKRMLVNGGYEVSTANDGLQAVELLMEVDGPRLVLLDWMMPGLNGPEVCRAIRNGPRRGYTYIVLLTSKDSKEDLVAGLESGADDYLIKPCNPEELQARLRTGRRILQLEDFLVEAREEMRFKATHDALTLLLDRGAILHQLASSLAQLGERQDSLSVLLCDVDHFKAINDTYGHPVGDEVLREIALRLKSAVRDGDAVGRYGGEEFLVLLNKCGPDNVHLSAQRICRSIMAEPIETSAGPLEVSISAGALSVHQELNQLSQDKILKSVDLALYQAKKDGRARAIVAEMIPSEALLVSRM